MEKQYDNIVGDLIDQLQSTNRQVIEAKRESNPLKKEEIEDFVIQKSGKLIEGTLEMIENVKDYISGAPESKDVSSLAELIGAATNTLETLNKMVLSNNKNKTLVDIKKMDIDAKKEMQDSDNQTKLLVTREEIFKAILNRVEPIEAEIIENKKIN
jgi:hypothetical protein